MSTKIYNGYYSDLSLDKLLSNFKELVPKFNDVKLENFTKYLVEEAVKSIDIKNSKGEVCDQSETIYSLYKKYRDEINESKKSNTRLMGDVDYSASCSLFPCGRKTLILFYSDNKNILDLWESLEYINDYHYQNQTDRPDKISSRDWNLRKKNWDKVLGGNGWGIPAHNGYSFTFNFIDAPNYYYIKDKFLQYIPSSEIRANEILHNSFVDNHYKILKENPDYEFRMSDYFDIMSKWKEWKKTDEYKTELEKINNSLINIMF